MQYYPDKTMSKLGYEQSKAIGTVQLVCGLPYLTRYFLDKPIIAPPEHMAGQRFYRPWVLEDARFDAWVETALIADDHSYAYIHPSLDDKHDRQQFVHSMPEGYPF
jgi:hypothetical protein